MAELRATTRRAAVMSSLLGGAVWAPPLVAVLYIGSTLLGSAFAPFDVFDWLTRQVPGPVLTYSIDFMVAVIRRLELRDTAATAKLVEQGIAITLFLAVTAGTGALVSTVASKRKSAGVTGLGLGVVLGIAVALGGGASDRVPGDGLLGALWVVVWFAAWGTAVAWTSARLRWSPRAAATTSHLDVSSVERIDRRRFVVRVGAASAVVTVAGAVVGQLVGRGDERRRDPPWSTRNPLPNAGAAVVPVPGTRPELTPLERHYRIDITTRAPVIDEERWRLQVNGLLVDRPVALTLAELRRRKAMDQFITLSCVSNPVAGDLIGTTRWTGVSLRELLPALGLRPQATHLKFHSADGFFETVSLATIQSDPRVMLAYAWDGVPLPVEHGFPLRIYIPDRYGMKQPKWIVSIEVLDEQEDGYWVVRGWDREARVKLTSVIDTVADTGMRDAEGHRIMSVGGIAHAGARGISGVEVRLDDGSWMGARIREPLSELTWALWRVDVATPPGDHTLTVRCTDGTGAPQIVDVAAPHPSGASGLHTRTARA